MPKKQYQTNPDIEHGAEPVLRTPQRRPSPPDGVSPADTFDTELTSPTRTFDSSDLSPPKPAKISIDVKQSRSTAGGSRSGAGLIFGLTKPFLLVGVLFLIATAAAGFLLKGWLKIPGLNRQIEALEVQVGRLNAEVNRLSGEVDRLEGENDRYESLNDRLNHTVAVFANLTDDLNATILELQDVTSDLNATNQELEEQVVFLTQENLNYAELNRELNTTANMLATEIEMFAQDLIQLTLENEMLSNLTDMLQNLTDSLSDLTVDQNETLLALQGTLNGFTQENDRLQQHNDDLVSLIEFLNNTSLGLDNSLQQVTGFLSEQITVNQQLVLQSLELSYQQKLNSWDCDYRDVFRETAFGQNFDVPITDLATVLNYVDERVLSELCLDDKDFEKYLGETYPDGLITTYRLIRGVVLYTTDAIDFYFPESDDTGLTIQDWSEASFDCQNLPSTFVWGLDGNQ